MTICNGAPAETNALAYLEGSLPEAEAERFEEHYFDCPVCLEHLQTLQAAAASMAKSPPPALTASEGRRKVLSWPATGWALGSVAAALLVVVFASRFMTRKPAAPAETASAANPTPSGAPQAAGSPSTQPAQGVPMEKPVEIADLILPAFAGSTLRGEGEDTQFQAGMTQYTKGDCGGALEALKQVSAESRELRAAQFYSGACRMHSGDLIGAEATLKAVAGAGDSAQQEAAYYYLAQVELAENDAPAAHRSLLATIALKGDFERKARAEDRKVLAMLDKDRPTVTGPTKSK